MVSDRIRAMGAMHWIVLFAAILAAWLVLFAMSIPSDLRIAARIYGTDLDIVLRRNAGCRRFGARVCHVDADVWRDDGANRFACFRHL